MNKTIAILAAVLALGACTSAEQRAEVRAEQARVEAAKTPEQRQAEAKKKADDEAMMAASTAAIIVQM